MIFGSPAAGTPVMAASPLAALDLPLKVLVWATTGRPRSRTTRRPRSPPGYHLGADLAGNLAAINPLTDALVAS